MGRRAGRLARAAVNLSAIDAALAATESDAPLDLTHSDDWPRLREFTADDIRESVGNLRVALAQAEEREDTTPIDAVLKGWRLSAEILGDPLGREIIYGPRGEDDFIKVSRPEWAMARKGS